MNARAAMVVLAVAAGGAAGVSGCSSPAEPPHTSVRVHALDLHGRPVADLVVYGHDAAGVVVARTVTDADGVADLELAEGSSITTFDTVTYRPPDYVRDRAYTVLDVAPGDDLAIPIEHSLRSPRQLTVHLPTLPFDADFATVSAPCAAWYGGSDVTIELDDRCPDRGAVVAFATDSFLRPYGYMVASAIDLTQGDFTIPGVWDQTPHLYTVDLTGGGLPSSSASASRGLVIGGQVVHTDRLVVPLGTGQATGRHPGIGPRTVYQVGIDDTTTCLRRQSTYTRSSATDYDAFAVSLAEMLAPLTDITVGDHAMAWTGGEGGVRITARMEASLPTGLVRTWTVVMPADRSEVRFPDIVEFPWPTGASADDQLSGAAVTVLASSRWSSYAEARVHHAGEPLAVDGDYVERTTTATATCLP